MSNADLILVGRWLGLLLLTLWSVGVSASAESQGGIVSLMTELTAHDVEIRLDTLQRELSVAVFAQARNPNTTTEVAQQLRSQSFELYAAAPNSRVRSQVLEWMQHWGLLRLLPSWNPQAALPQLAVPHLPQPPNKHWLEANTDVDKPSRPLVVHFWAHWCGPCRHELPQLAQFYQEQYLTLQSAGIDLVTVNNDPIFNPKKRPTDLPASLQHMPVLHDPDFRLYRQLANSHSVALPATFFVQPGQPHRVLAYGPIQWLAPGFTQALALRVE